MRQHLTPITCSAFLVLNGISFGCHKPQIEEIPDVKGLDEASVCKRFGSPTRQEVFTLTSKPLEYRNGLLAHFSELDKQKPRIKELYWKTANGHQAIWLSLQNDKMIVVDSLRWPNDVRF